MWLMDRIAGATAPVRVRMRSGVVIDLPGAAGIVADLRATPVRYILNDDVAATVSHAAYANLDRLAQCMDLLRIPAPQLWVEWSEPGKLRTMAELGLSETVNGGAPRARAGLLVQSDATGRRGEITPAWINGDAEPDLSPVTILFDLDDDTTGAQPAPDGRPTLRPRVEEADSLNWILSHARFQLAREWEDYYRAAAPSAQQFRAAIDEAVRMVMADLPFLIAFCLILQARSALSLRPSDLQRLNMARARTHKPALLEHIQVAAFLDDAARGAGSGLHADRAAARLHFVSGHLVRRDGGVHWRRAHARGAPGRGAIATRTVLLRAQPKGGAG